MNEQPRSPAAVLGCSYAAASASLLINFPLDTIKTRLQTSSDSLGRSISTLYNEQGIRGFYSGVTASLLSASAARAMTMSMYCTFIPYCASVLHVTMTSPNDRPLAPVFLAGLTAGAISCSFTAPFEFAKTASQVESLILRSKGEKLPIASPVKSVRNVVKRGGLRAIYGGVEYHCLRDSLGTAIYFSVYESIKKLLTNRKHIDEGKPSPFAVAVAGASCGSASWLAVYPIDTMKSNYQRDLYSHALIGSHTESNVKRPEFRLSSKMYRGLAFSLMRTSFNGMLLFTFYEYLMYITA